MPFDKLKFEQITVDGESKFLINGQEVDFETYDKIMMDDSLYTFPPLPKTNGIPDDKCSFEGEDLDLCEECQELMDIIEMVREVDDEEALNIMRDFVGFTKMKASGEALIGTLGDLANQLNRVVAKIEINLEQAEDEMFEEE